MPAPEGYGGYVLAQSRSVEIQAIALGEAWEGGNLS
jgi:hypothetical protein